MWHWLSRNRRARESGGAGWRAPAASVASSADDSIARSAERARRIDCAASAGKERAVGPFMRAILMAFALACPLVTTATALGQASSGNDTTVRDGVYSEAQAKRGQADYVDKCSECHDDG